jgi:ER lumen protein retaining receptor
MLVSFSMFMECIGLLPQFIVMRKAKEVEGLTSHYIAFLGLGRLIRLIFWIVMYWEGDTFGYLIIADLLHAILLGDFAYYYLKSIQSGKSILLS